MTNENGILMSNGEPVHIRELHTLLDGFKKEILAEIKDVNNNLEQRIQQVDTETNAKFDVHKVEHEREHDHRSNLWRWSITTIVLVVLGVAGLVVQFIINS